MDIKITTLSSIQRPSIRDCSSADLNTTAKENIIQDKLWLLSSTLSQSTQAL